MKTHLYKVVDIAGIEQDAYTVVDCVDVMTENDLRDEFMRVVENGWLPSALLADYKNDPDYSKENWDDLSKLSAGTMADMLSDIGNYNGEHYYLVLETDIEI